MNPSRSSASLAFPPSTDCSRGTSCRGALERAHRSQCQTCSSRRASRRARRPDRRSQPPEWRSDAESRRRATDGAACASSRRARHRAARSPDRRRRRAVLQLPRSRRARTLRRREEDNVNAPGHHVAGLSGAPRASQASSLRSDPFGASGLTGPAGRQRMGNYVMAQGERSDSAPKRRLRARREDMHERQNPVSRRRDDRRGDPHLSRVRHDRTGRARQTVNTSRSTNRASRVSHISRRSRSRSTSTLGEQPARLVLIGEHRADGPEGALPRRAVPARTGRSRPRRAQHAAALAVAPTRDAIRPGGALMARDRRQTQSETRPPEWRALQEVAP